MPRNRAARRRAARMAPRSRSPRPATPRLQGRTRLAARIVAALAGIALLAVVIALLATPISHGNPARAVRGLLIVLALAAILLWWGITGKGL